MPVPETQRRKNHIDLIDPNHALLLIATDCLEFQDKDRPSSEELCQRLASLKETRGYKESVQNQQDEIQAKDSQIEEKDRLLQQRTEDISSLTQQLQDKNYQLQQAISSRERQLRQLNQQLEEKEQVTAEIQQTNHSLQRQVEQLQQQLSQQNLKPPQPPPPSQVQVRGRQLQERESPKHSPVQPLLQVDHKPHPHRAKKMMSLKWRDGGKTPVEMERGVAVVDGNVAYFMHLFAGKIYSYSYNKSFEVLPICPHGLSSLAIINGQLTAIGGSTYSGYTNKLLSLQINIWTEIFPPMPTKRCGTTAVTSKEHLIVAGGHESGVRTRRRLAIVEVMDTKTLVWSTVASLPHPYYQPSGTICGDQLYMLGGCDDKGRTKSMLTCSLTELLQSSSSSSIWHRVADAPVYFSTCAAVNGELLAVGGIDNTKPTAAIHKYSPTTNSWDLISNMPTARYKCLVAVLPTNEMMVVGGKDKVCLSKVEIANF